MLPTTRYDVYDNDKGRRGLNLAASSFVVSLRQMRLRVLVLLLALVGLLSLYVLTAYTHHPSSIPSPTPAPVLGQKAIQDPRFDGLASPGDVAVPREVPKAPSDDEYPADAGNNGGSNADYQGAQKDVSEDEDEDKDEDEDEDEDQGNAFDHSPPIEENEKRPSAASNGDTKNEWTKEKDAVIGAFQHAWSGYKRYAWGHDELHPISHRGSDWFHLGLTLVDSLDLMLMMGLKDEFDEAREWVRTSIQYHTGESNLFEVTIRVLGGFLSAHALSGDQLFADRAAELGERLMAAFSSGTPIPFASVDLRDKKGIPAGHNGGDSSTAEVTTIQLEFTALSRVTGDPKYAEAADRVTQHILSLNRPHGLVPIFIK